MVQEIAESTVAASDRQDSGKRPSRLFFKILFLTLLAFYAVLLPILGSAAVVLLLSAETWRGRMFAICALCLLLIPLSAVLGSRWPVRRWWRFVPLAVCSLGCLALSLTLLALTPTGQSLQGSQVGSHWPNPPAYPRYSPFNLLPERDQVKLGIYLLGSTDLALAAEQAPRVREVTMSLYRQMDQSHEYAQLGSALHYNWTDALGGSTGTGHFYYCVPEHKPGERLPMILFAHGSAGNFRSYLYFWQKFSEQFRCVIVCPTFGSGNWKQPGGGKTIQRARSYAIEHYSVDPQRVYLAGLSNGGLGVSRAARDHPDDYRGLIYISSVVESDIFNSTEFVAGWQGRPVLIIHGSHDRRIPQTVSDEATEALLRNETRVTYLGYPEESHFLMFCAREQVYKDIAAWIRQNESDHSDATNQKTPE